MSKLHELAQRLGVEIWEVPGGGCGVFECCGRPGKDIAHEMLEKLPPQAGIECEVAVPVPNRPGWDRRWIARWNAVWLLDGTFEEAVCALAERYLSANAASLQT